jgi:2'-5' RNA ligase
MPLAVTLRLDDETAAAVKRMWHALAEQTGDDDALRLGYAPHLTLALMPDDSSAADAERVVLDLAGTWNALPLTLAGFGVFPASPPVIWVAPVVTGSLLAYQSALHAALHPIPIDAHYHVGAWVPHVTLTQGAKSSARAVEAVSSVWSGPIGGIGDRVELVRFHPVEILCSTVLRRGAADVGPASGRSDDMRNS